MPWNHPPSPIRQEGLLDKKPCIHLGRVVRILLSFLACLSFCAASVIQDVPPSVSDDLQISPAVHQTESIVLESEERVGVLLTRGKSEEFTFSWIVNLESSGVDKDLRVSEYEKKLRCDDSSILDGEADCELTTSDAEEDGDQDFFSFNVIAVCTAKRFPGLAKCRLSLEKLPGSSTTGIESEEKSILVSGLTIYSLGGATNDSVSRDTEIYSGTGNGFIRTSFLPDDSTNGPLFGVRIFLPDGTRVIGGEAGQLINRADISTDETDAVFLYDQDSCLPGNFSSPQASKVAGVLQLAPAETCGLGTAASQDSLDSVLGVRIRPFKVGRKEMTFTWSDFRIGNPGDRADVPYAQVLSIEVQDSQSPPPVIKEISFLTENGEFSSAPCGIEGRNSSSIFVRAYNVRYSESRRFQILPSGEGGEVVQEWDEDDGSFSYDQLTDSSTFSFQNQGGSGRNLGYQLAVKYEGESEAKVAVSPKSATVPTDLNFSSPVVVQDMLPSTVDYRGGEVVLIGDFRSFSLDSGDRIVVEGAGIPSGESAEILSQNLTHIIYVAPAIDQARGIHIANIQVEVCGNPLTEIKLTYGVPPVASLWSADLSPLTSSPGAENGTDSKDSTRSVSSSYLLPNSDTSIAFVVDNIASNPSVGSYEWTLSRVDGSRIELEETAADISTFAVKPNSLPESCLLTVAIGNEAGSDALTVSLTKAPPGQPLLAVSLYPVPRLTKSRWSQPASVHSSVQLFGKDLNSRIAFEWEYLGQTYLVGGEIESSSSPFSSNTTAPTKFGQQFNIAPQDLTVGSRDIKLTAYLEGDVNIRGSASLTLEVLDFDDIAVEKPDILDSPLEGIRFQSLEGNPIVDLNYVNSLQDILIRPESGNDDVSWTFQLRRDGKTLDLNEEVPLLSERADNDGAKREYLILRAGALQDDQKYVLVLQLLDEKSEEESELEVDFRTAPRMETSCTSSGSPAGFADETQFVVSSQASPSHVMDFVHCFYIVNLVTNSRDLVGLGCSRVRVAKFLWPVVGNFDIECEIQTLAGKLLSVEKALPDTQLQVSARRGSTVATRSNAEARAVTIDEQRAKLRKCVFSRNSICMLQMASTFPQLLAPGLSPGDDAAESQLEIQAGEELTANICDLLRAMSLETAFTPGDVLSAASASASMTSLPPDFFDPDSLLNCVYPLSLAINATSESAQAPISDKRLTESLNFIANYSITTAANLAATSNRTRLLSDVNDGGGGNTLFTLLLEELPMFSAQIALQNEGCGFEKAFDTSVPGGLPLQPPVHMYMRVLCGAEEEAKLKIRGLFEKQPDVELSICKELLSENLLVSGSERFSVVVKQTDPGQFCSTLALAGAHSIFTSPLEISFPRQKPRGDGILPEDCIRIKVPRLTGVPCQQPNFQEGDDPLPMSISRNSTMSRQAATASYLPSIIQAGSIEGFETIQSSTDLNRTKSLTVQNEGVLVLLGEKDVEFKFRRSGQVLAAYTRPPGDVPTGATVNLGLIVGLAVGAIALGAIGLVSTQGRLIAGVPLAIDGTGPYVERDLFGRVWTPHPSELLPAPGYESAGPESGNEAEGANSRNEVEVMQVNTIMQHESADLEKHDEVQASEHPGPTAAIFDSDLDWEDEDIRASLEDEDEFEVLSYHG